MNIKYTAFSFYILFSSLLSSDRSFMFSIIIAIYNSGRYLDDSIGSLINQTFDFQKIQIILVNDGSVDETEQICLKYKNKYKKNIVYIKTEHNGVSKARNIGMHYANGTYINFLDSDDKWDYQALEYFLLFFNKNKDIDLVAGRIKFFEAKEKYHPLDYKFYKSRVVNLSEEYNSIQLSVSSCIFKKSLIKGKYFTENIFFCEDSKFINSILLKNPVMGLLKEAIYYYRRRDDFSSAINKQNQNLNYYFGTIKDVSNYLINASKTLYNKIVPFIQFLLIYDIIFRIKTDSFKFLDNNNFRKYCILIEEILKQVDDKYIIEQKSHSNKYKLFTLSKKYETDLRNNIVLVNNIFIYSSFIMIDLNKDKKIIIWRRVNIKNNTLFLEGLDNLWLPRENYFYFCRIGNKKFFPMYFSNSNYDFITMYGLSQNGRIVTFEIPLEISMDKKVLYFYIFYMNKNAEILTSLYSFENITTLYNSYYASENYIIKFIANRFTVYIYNQKLENKFEKLFCYELYKAKKAYLIEIRKYKKSKNNINKNFEIWIINDRHDRAGDNGEYFFRYLNVKKPEKIKIYFAIKKSCDDYKRLKKYGNVLDLYSTRYIKTVLQSTKIISSIDNIWINNPFKRDSIYLMDLFNYDFIFLNNGIIKDDLTTSFNRFETHFNLFVTSSKREYKSIINSNYGYVKDHVILTGMPRYDNLQKLKYTNQKKVIMIAPTWRKNIQGVLDILSFESKYSDIFKYTEYFKFYNNLINDKRLIFIMGKYNFKGLFCLHPLYENQWIDFKENEIFSVIKKCDYQNLLLKASLLITDYSSIFFDFGYLEKPIIYAHFDYEEYRESNYPKGYFDYTLDGFGAICKDINCVINEILFEIENNFILKKKYEKRIKKFFAFSDCNNCKRIFERIISKKEEKSEYNILYVILFLYLFKIFLIIK